MQSHTNYGPKLYRAIISKDTQKLVACVDLVLSGNSKFRNLDNIFEPSDNISGARRVYQGLSPLTLSVCKGTKEMVGLLLSRGADVNYRDVQRKTALIHAVCKGNKEMVGLLLNNGANIEYTMMGKTPLIWAVWKGRKEIVKLLLDNGANINAVDSRGQTALMLAKQQEKTEIFQLIAAHAMIRAIGRGDLSEVQILINQGADVNYSYRQHKTALIHAVCKCNKEIVQLLCGLNLSVARASFYITTVLGLGLIGFQAVKNMAVVKGALGIYNNWVLYGLMALFLVSAVVLGRQSYKVEKCLKSYQQLGGLKESTGPVSTIGVLSGCCAFPAYNKG